jgi:ribonuclease H2 subunit A
MVYACAFAPLSFSETLEGLGFDDSKALSHETRDHLFSLFRNPAGPSSQAEGEAECYNELHYSTRVLSPQDISTNMMRGISPINLNKQAEDATVLLIREVLARGIDLAEVRRRIGRRLMTAASA